METKPAPVKPDVDEKKMSVSKETYGKLPDGTEIDQYTLCNPNGLRVKIITYGAIMTAVEMPDRNGKLENITLYRDSLADYMETEGRQADHALLRRHGRPLRQPHRQGPIHPGRQGIHSWPSTTAPTPCTAA